jgi:C4-dicarboxylate-specific signal transduction histidine kinase
VSFGQVQGRWFSGNSVDTPSPALLEALETGRPVYRRNPEEMARYGDVSGPRQSVLDVPFSGGTVAVASSKPEAFGSREVGILSRFAAVADEAYQRLLDLRALADLQEAMEAQRHRAVQADRLQTLGEMAAGMSHELNQPLNGIRTFAEGALYGLRQGWDTSTSELREVLADIVLLVDRMTETIDHMRVFSRDPAQTSLAEFRLADAVEGAIKLVGAQLRVHGVSLQVEVPADLPAVSGYVSRVEQVLLNLIANARDAMEDRRQRQGAKAPSPELSIRGAVTEARDRVRLTVTDNGGGIPEAVIDRIFDPFYTTKDVGRGTGLGLSIALGITEQHGGTLEVQSRPGDGATFVLSLPVARHPRSLEGVAGSA